MPLMKYLKPVFYFSINITVLLANEAMLTDIYCKKLTNFNISQHAVFILDIASETVLFNREEHRNTA